MAKLKLTCIVCKETYTSKQGGPFRCDKCLKKWREDYETGRRQKVWIAHDALEVSGGRAPQASYVEFQGSEPYVPESQMRIAISMYEEIKKEVEWNRMCKGVKALGNLLPKGKKP